MTNPMVYDIQPNWGGGNSSMILVWKDSHCYLLTSRDFIGGFDTALSRFDPFDREEAVDVLGIISDELKEQGVIQHYPLPVHFPERDIGSCTPILSNLIGAESRVV